MYFEVEEHIAPPQMAGKGNKKYPFSTMQPGSSFHVSGAKAFDRARLAASQFGIRKGMKFSGRKEGDGGRIWRIE